MSRTHSTSTGISRHGPLNAERVPTGLHTLGKMSGRQHDLESPCRACYLQEIPGDAPAGRKGQQDVLHIAHVPTPRQNDRLSHLGIFQPQNRNLETERGHC